MKNNIPRVMVKTRNLYYSYKEESKTIHHSMFFPFLYMNDREGNSLFRSIRNAINLRFLSIETNAFWSFHLCEFLSFRVV